MFKAISLIRTLYGIPSEYKLQMDDNEGMTFVLGAGIYHINPDGSGMVYDLGWKELVLVPPPQAEEPPRPPSRREAQAGIKRGNRHFKACRPADALTEYLIAIEADPTYAPPLYLTAMCYARLGKRDLAIDYLRQVKALNSGGAGRLVCEAANEPEFESMRVMDTFKGATTATVEADQFNIRESVDGLALCRSFYETIQLEDWRWGPF